MAEDEGLAKEMKALQDLRTTDPEAALRASKTLESKLVLSSVTKAVGADIVAELGAMGVEPAGLRRILAKGPEVGNVKGRLFDEIFATQAKKEVATVAGKEAMLGGKKLAPEIMEKLEFIPGSSITDLGGEELTDGMLAWREGDVLHPVEIYEAKAGQRVATQLRLLEERMSRIPAKDLEEVKKYAGELFTELSEKAAKSGTPLKLTAEDINNELLKYRVQKQLGGQVRETIERLDVNVSLKSELDIPPRIKVNGEEMEVVGVSGRSRVTGVVPSDVKTAGIEKALKGEGLNFAVKKLAIKQADVDALATKISEAATKTPVAH